MTHASLASHPSPGAVASATASSAVVTTARRVGLRRWLGGALPLALAFAVLACGAAPERSTAAPAASEDAALTASEDAALTASDAASDDPFARFGAHADADATTVDHGPWDALLVRHRSIGDDGIARFAYGAITADERAALEAYIATLESVDPTTLGRNAQMAYWFNLYNARTVLVILGHPDAPGIRDIDLTEGRDGPWFAPLMKVSGVALSLDDVEHRILRRFWNDPRIHVGVNCASLGCPDIPARAFTAENLEAQLAAGAKAFVHHPRGVTFLDDGTLRVSSIFVWFQEDFGGSEAAMVDVLATWAEGELAARLAAFEGPVRDDYDWTLNGTRGGSG